MDHPSKPLRLPSSPRELGVGRLATRRVGNPALNKSHSRAQLLTMCQYRETNLQHHPSPYRRLSGRSEGCLGHILPSRCELHTSTVPSPKLLAGLRTIGRGNKLTMGDMDDIPVVQDSVSKSCAECGVRWYVPLLGRELALTDPFRIQSRIPNPLR